MAMPANRLPLFGFGSHVSNSSTVSTGSPANTTGTVLGISSNEYIDTTAEEAKRRAREDRRAAEQAIIFSIVREEVQKALREIARAPLR